jgi:hypothetical protein
MYRMMIAAALLVTTAVDNPVMAVQPGTPGIKGQSGPGSVYTGIVAGGGRARYGNGATCTAFPCNKSNFNPGFASPPQAKPKPKP